jgi:quinol monooxygenase YgiN
MNLLAVQASLAICSVLWGAVASWADTRVALIASAIAMLVLLFLNRNVRVRLGREADVTHDAQLPDLGIKVEPLPDDGPVLIQIEYRIDAANRAAFLKGIRKVEPTRRRNGASSWRVFRDLSEDGRFVERYIIDSWAEYVRLRRRMTLSDRQVQDEVTKLQRADTPIRVSRLLGVDLDEETLVVPDDVERS